MSGKPTKILLVDDQPEIRILMRSLILENYDAIIMEASNGQEANWKLANDEFDLLITDLRMPKYSGIELIKALSAKDPKKRPKKIIILSAFIDRQLAQTLEQKKIDVILKPIDEDVTLMQLDQYMARKVAA